uniref:Rho-GAP domain-containing protein n=1 Tax=Arcella intermedia TaxID=1963864 RepID=A0A6B2L508_9EUKA
MVLAAANKDAKEKLKELEFSSNIYSLKEIWPLKSMTLNTAPEPVEDDDKISFDVTLSEHSQSPIHANIISDDNFFAILRDQVDQSGDKVFGVDLMKLAKRTAVKDGIPEVVSITTNWIRDCLNRTSDVEGIFRKSGSYAEVEELKSRFDTGTVNSLGPNEDEHVIANIIKLYFREMPVPLIPFSHYHRFMEIAAKNAEISQTELLEQLKSPLASVPRPHLLLLFYLLKFLNDVSKFSQVTKMDSSNLAIVFASNIIKAQEETIEATLKFNHINSLIKIMIDNAYLLEKLVPIEPLNEEKNMDTDFIVQEIIKHTKLAPVYIDDPPALPLSDLPPPPYIPKPPENDIRDSRTERNRTSPRPATERNSRHSNHAHYPTNPALPSSPPMASAPVKEEVKPSSVLLDALITSPRRPSARTKVNPNRK